MEKTRMENQQGIPRTRKKHKSNLIKALIYAFIGLGSLALLISIIYISSILAFIGLGLVFWGALLLYIQPEEYTKKALLDSAVIPPLESLSQIIQELDYKGKPIYLPPKYFKDPEANKVYIPKQKDGKLPEPELTLKHENQLFIQNPKAILLTPPGAQLSKLFEKQLETTFTKTDLNYVTQNLPKLLIEDLEIAENIEIETENNKIKTKIINSTFKETHNQPNKHSHLYTAIGCPLSSAIACALTRATGKPITIQNIQTFEDGKVIQTTYQILEKIETETETILPRIKPELPLTEPIQLQFRKLFLPYLVSLLLTVIGSVILAQVAWITYHDMTIWGKDITQIFLESRTEQAISLGIGMKIIHYFILGLASFLSGIFTYLRNRSKV
jgi:hypothetical protein